MNKLFLQTLGVLCLSSITLGAPYYGADSLNLVGTAKLNCLEQNLVNFIIPVAYTPSSGNSANAVALLKAAKTVPFDFVDVLFKPCYNPQLSPASQLNSMIDYIELYYANPPQQDNLKRISVLPSYEPQVRSFLDWRADNVPFANGYGMIWIDITQNTGSCRWSTNTQANCDYLRSLIRASTNSGRVPGVYTTAADWTAIMGSQTACSQFWPYPLWVGVNDNTDDFSFYTRIGGWIQPAMKRSIYGYPSTICPGAIYNIDVVNNP